MRPAKRVIERPECELVDNVLYIVEGQGFRFVGRFIDPFSEDDTWDGMYWRFISFGKHSSAFLELSTDEFRQQLYSVRRYFGDVIL